MPNGPIRISREGAVLQLVLSDPERGNPIRPDFTEGLAAAVADLTGVRCIVLTAEGSNFCLGGDIVGFAAAEDPSAYIFELARVLHGALALLDEADVPVVVGVQGWAAGAGLSLVLAGDIVVLERSCRLRTAYGAIGLTPDGGMTWTLPRAVGAARAMDMLLTNRPMNAEEALAAGLASRIVDDGTAADQALVIARNIAAGPPHALAGIRHLARRGRDHSFREQLDSEQASIAHQAGGHEGREGVAAFLGRRSPNWSTSLEAALPS